MANKQSNQSEESRRRSRKEILQKRKEQEQKRNVYIGAGLILGLLGIIFLAALIIEFAVTPNQAIAEVNGEEITVREWEERVQFERTQRVIFLEDQLDTFGDVGFLQQNFPQLINELYPEQGQPELFAQSVKEQMVDDLGIQQAAEARGITVTDEEVDAWIEESFGYLGGVSPTPFPTPTETVEPTPSITPIATAVITELVPTNTPFPTVTPGPTNTPAPTPTPISEATYRQEYNELLAQYETYGISEAQYRDYVRNLLYREKLADALAEEQDLPQAVDHASFLFIFFESEEEANEAAAQIETDGFLQTWNEIRSGLNDNEESSAFASEILWRDEDTIAQTFGSEVAEAAMSLDLNQPSDVLEQVVDAETNRYFIIYITGREVRELSEGAYDQDKQEALEAFLVEALAGTVNYTDAEVGREPTQPRLDPIFFTAPTATPVAPLPGLVTPEN